VGGGNRSILGLWSGLRSLDVIPHAIVPGSGDMSRLCREAGVSITEIPAVEPNFRQWWATVISGTRFLRTAWAHKSQLLHSNELRAARRGALLPKLLSIPHVCHVRFRADPEYVNWVFRGLPSPHLFIFNSHALQKEMGASLARICPQSQQEVVHNGVDLERFRPAGVSPHRRRVGIVANLLPVKGHGDFLEMAKILQDRGAGAEFRIIGKDHRETGYGEELQRRARELGLEDVVEFLGFRDDVPQALHELDVVVCPSHEEPFGRSIIEAMACARPVVAARVGGIPEIIEDETHGFLVPKHSPRELADAVQRLLTSSELRAARLHVCERFSNESHVRRIYDIYRMLLNRCAN
jgi:glycosyltransferase involved in cell wall biosynthesis